MITDSTEIFVGIDNSNSGAIAILCKDGAILYTNPMPLINDESDHASVVNMIHHNGGGQHNTRVMLEEPHRFAKGISAVRVMWSCFHRLDVGLELSGMLPDRILPNQWQTKMLDVYGDKKSKFWAEKRVVDLWGNYVINKYKSKKQREGINDALLIAEFCRRSHLGLDMPEKKPY